MVVIGTVVSNEANVQVAKKDGGSYPGSRLSYRDETGALKEQAFHQMALKFGNLKAQLEAVKPGDVIEITKEKKGEYWNVISIVPATAGAVQSTATKTTPSASPKSTYETPEERATKQIYIVRQSSISNAIALLAIGAKNEQSSDEALKIAKQFEEFVFGTQKGFDDHIAAGGDYDIQ